MLTKKLMNDEKIINKIIFNGVLPSPEDKRDYTIDMVAKAVTVFPEEFELKPTEILNQGVVGSCVAHACATALMSGEETILGNHDNFSRGYIYANRLDSDHQSSGMSIRQALKQLNKCGDVLYDDFPYNKEYPGIKSLIKNPEELAAKAKPYAIKDYYRCYAEDDIKTTIMNRGGVIICVPVYYKAFTRDAKKPDSNDINRGYHALIIIGWTKDGRWIVQNSWGKTWGYSGKLYMDKDYPIIESWGITINTENVKPIKKSNIFIRFVVAIKNIINKLISVFKR